LESHLRSFATLRPDHLISETAVRSEFSHHGISSRLRKGRADVRHQFLDPLIIVGPEALLAAGGYMASRKLVKRLKAGRKPT
jgi:hypothetical protein